MKMYPIGTVHSCAALIIEEEENTEAAKITLWWELSRDWLTE